MRNLESRLIKLEQKHSKKTFLVVYAEPGETRKQSIDRFLKKNNLTPEQAKDHFLMYFNLIPSLTSKQNN